jgi:hypothetical protein
LEGPALERGFAPEASHEKTSVEMFGPVAQERLTLMKTNRWSDAGHRPTLA